MSGADIAAEVLAGLAQAGAETGTGGPLVGAILRKGVTDESYYPPNPSPPTEHPCTVVLMDFGTMERTSSAIRVGDVKAMIGTDAGITPTSDDKLRIGAQVYSLISVDVIQPGGVPLYFEAQARGD